MQSYESPCYVIFLQEFQEEDLKIPMSLAEVRFCHDPTLDGDWKSSSSMFVSGKAARKMEVESLKYMLRVRGTSTDGKVLVRREGYVTEIEQYDLDTYMAVQVRVTQAPLGEDRPSGDEEENDWIEEDVLGEYVGAASFAGSFDGVQDPRRDVAVLMMRPSDATGISFNERVVIEIAEVS